MKSSNYYIPTGAQNEDLHAWYGNIEKELRAGFLTSQESKYIRDYYEEAGLLRAWRLPFFRQHFSKTFARSLSFLMAAAARPRILDLGAGTGTQSLCFALRGARVVAVDMDTFALGILEKRRKHYEAQTGIALDIEIVAGNALTLDWSSLGTFDGLYSMFAFNMIQPSDGLLRKIIPQLRPGSRLAILDGNNQSWLPRLYPPRRRKVLSPVQMEKTLRDNGFHIDAHRGGISLPPILWTMGAPGWLEKIDDRLDRNWFFPISHLIHASH